MASYIDPTSVHTEVSHRDVVDATNEIGICTSDVIIAESPIIADHDLLIAIESFLGGPKQNSGVRDNLSSKTCNNSPHTQGGTAEGFALENGVAESLVG